MKRGSHFQIKCVISANFNKQQKPFLFTHGQLRHKYTNGRCILLKKKKTGYPTSLTIRCIANTLRAQTVHINILTLNNCF